MVKNKQDKTKLSNWEEGDVFALRINSEEHKEYNGKYIILIHTIINKDNWKMTRTTNSFRAKITKDSILPKTKEELEKLEYIKIYSEGYLLEKTRFPKETKNLYPDKYHLIYKYLFVIKSFKYKVPEDLIYIGNFNLEKPINEYIPVSQHHGVLYSFWNEKYSKIVEKLLNSYEWLNLKKSTIFTKEGQKQFLYNQKENIKVWQEIDDFIVQLKKVNKSINETNSKTKEIQKNGFETYVGGSEILDILNKKQK